MLGDAQLRSHAREALTSFAEAAEVARAQGSPEDFARAALGVEESELYKDVAGEAASLLNEALVALGEDDTTLRCRVLSHLGRASFKLGGSQQASAMMREATSLARRLGDPRAIFDALYCEHIATAGQPWSAAQFPIRRNILKEMVAIAEQIGDHPELTYTALTFEMSAALEMGDLATFEANLARVCEIVQENQFAGQIRYVATSAGAMQAILSGDFVGAEQLANRALEFATDIHDDVATGIYGMQMFTIRREQGRLAEIAPLVRRFVTENVGAAAWRPGLALIASDLGFDKAARKSFDDLAATGFAFPRDAKRNLTLCYLAEVCTRLGDTDRAPKLYELLLPYRDLAVVVPTVTVSCGAVARYLGMLARAMEDWKAAEEHFEAALDLDGRLKAWPWLAHTKHEFALALHARGRPGDRDRAETLLAEAAATAERFGMASLDGKIRLATT